MRIVYCFLTLTNNSKATEILVNKVNQDCLLEDQFRSKIICIQSETWSNNLLKDNSITQATYSLKQKTMI